jgi:hypothetical protein
MQDQETAVADQNTTEVLSMRESRLAIILFELIKPQLEKMIDTKLEYQSSSEFDIHEHESAINDMIDDYIRYNITITSTID